MAVGGLGGLGQRGDGAGGGERLDQPVGDDLGEAAPGHPLGDGGAEHVVRHGGAAGGKHVEEAGAAGVLEAPGTQRAHDHLLGAGGVVEPVVDLDARREPAEHGDGDVAPEDGVLGAPELGARGGVGAHPVAQAVAAGEQAAGDGAGGRRRGGRGGRKIGGGCVPHGGGLVPRLLGDQSGRSRVGGC
ncbi:hypothetical protein BJF78_25480 [Pseudonocardia sp. CNS-139]|nr:hypothetical protein BJF78_25480 [Pseudonocardia sp. CNS-139]